MGKIKDIVQRQSDFVDNILPAYKIFSIKCKNAAEECRLEPQVTLIAFLKSIAEMELDNLLSEKAKGE